MPHTQIPIRLRSKEQTLYRIDLSRESNNGNYPSINWAVTYHPRALSLTSAGNVIVGFYSPVVPGRVQEYTSSGLLVREISDNISKWAQQAVELSNGRYVVSRRDPEGSHGIFITSIHTSVQHSYGNQPGLGDGKMDTPNGLTMYQQRYILVADSENHRILVVNPSFTEARPLPLPAEAALRGPYALILDQSRDRLYVGEWTYGNQGRLLVLDNVTNVGTVYGN